MVECLKDKCRLWKRSCFKGCSLGQTLERECLETGEFQLPKLNVCVPMDEWEDVKPFTILDLAEIGVCHSAIRDFAKGTDVDHWLQYSAVEHETELTMLGIFDTLERFGFVTEKVERAMFGELMMIEDGRVFKLLGPVSGSDWISVFSMFEGRKIQVPESFFNSAIKVIPTWREA
jgi:hypothetical protein